LKRDPNDSDDDSDDDEQDLDTPSSDGAVEEELRSDHSVFIMLTTTVNAPELDYKLGMSRQRHISFEFAHQMICLFQSPLDPVFRAETRQTCEKNIADWY
jgi:hypothetical protein